MPFAFDNFIASGRCYTCLSVHSFLCISLFVDFVLFELALSCAMHNIAPAELYIDYVLKTLQILPLISLFFRLCQLCTLTWVGTLSSQTRLLINITFLTFLLHSYKYNAVKSENVFAVLCDRTLQDWRCRPIAVPPWSFFLLRPFSN
jgi:hypothetical protein